MNVHVYRKLRVLIISFESNFHTMGNQKGIVLPKSYYSVSLIISLFPIAIILNEKQIDSFLL